VAVVSDDDLEDLETAVLDSLDEADDVDAPTGAVPMSAWRRARSLATAEELLRL
jgi:hypothetical protein